MMKKIIAIVTILILTLSVSCYSIASSISDLQNQKNEAENNKNNAEDELEEVQAEKNETLSAIDELSSQINESEEQLEKLNEQIKSLEAEIEKTEKELKDATERQEAQQKALEQRIVAQYKTGTLSYWEIFLNPKSPLEFISNIHMFNKIAKYDNELIDSIEQEKQKIEKAKQELDNKKSEVKIAKANAEKENVKLKNAKAKKNSQVAKLSEQEKEIQKQIDEYDEEMNNLKRQIAAAQAAANGNGPTYSGGKLAWPTPGYYNITSKYGMRIHPIFGVWKLHAGIDLGAPKNANFVAAEDGVVIASTYSSSYGNMVIINHGGGITTLYAHGTSRLVSVGDKVTRGQAVLTVGSTGNSTGNHAHFEVRVNGSPVDPLPYLQ